MRYLVSQVERCRDLIIELQEDVGESVGKFRPPVLRDNRSLDDVAAKIRRWLGVDSNLEFQQWRESVERKGVFVFMTSKYRGWSYIDKKFFRGLARNHSTLPIIIINNSDAKKAYSFTLLHELAHLIRNEDAIDGWSKSDKEVERWCDRLAATVLMPKEQFQSETPNNINHLKAVKKLANSFHVSPYACLVRLEGFESDRTIHI